MTLPPTRAAGVLLHPTSLPSPYGIGDLGPEVDRWLEWVERSGCAIWQVLPLGPTSFGDSPYQCFSTAAGNPLLISPDLLAAEGLLDPGSLEPQPVGPVDYGSVIGENRAMLDAARRRLDRERTDEFEAFRTDESAWLDDYALFMALKDAHDGRAWTEWEEPLRGREDAALDEARASLADAIEVHAFAQWLFFRQWDRVRALASERGIQIFGDLPLYVAADSADVWANPHLFELGEDGRPTVVAGVPPDYFSPTGQLWGNPIYRWETHAATGYGWWIERMQRTLRMVDLVRIDHFRGFVDYWEIPAGAPTAERGRWVDGPGADLFDALAEALGELPIVAEDLGDLSPGVYELRDELGFPGMNIVQFGWDGDPENPFHPDRIHEYSVAYTGTHDNDTAIGWYETAPEREREAFVEFAGPGEVAAAMLRVTWETVARLAIAPIQDVLALPTEARMNTPGVEEGNWRWRLEPGWPTADDAAALRSLSEESGRL